VGGETSGPSGTMNMGRLVSEFAVGNKLSLADKVCKVWVSDLLLEGFGIKALVLLYQSPLFYGNLIRR